MPVDIGYAAPRQDKLRCGSGGANVCRVLSKHRACGNRRRALERGARCRSGDPAVAKQGFARRSLSQLSLKGHDLIDELLEKIVGGLAKDGVGVMTTTAPPNPSARVREHVKDDTADTYFSVDDRRTMS